MLGDDNSWVQYDACWLVKDHGYMGPSDSEVMRKIAGNMMNLSINELENLKPNEASAYAAKKATQAIDAQRYNVPNALTGTGDLYR